MKKKERSARTVMGIIAIGTAFFIIGLLFANSLLEGTLSEISVFLGVISFMISGGAGAYLIMSEDKK